VKQKNSSEAETAMTESTSKRKCDPREREAKIKPSVSQIEAEEVVFEANGRRGRRQGRYDVGRGSQRDNGV